MKDYILNNLFIKIIIIIFITLTFSCEKKTEDILMNMESESNNQLTLKEEPDPPSGCVKLLQINRGTKTYDEETQTKFCENSKKWCWLWFQPCDEKGVSNGGTTIIKLNLKAKELKLKIYLGKLSSQDRRLWERDRSIGYVDITDTISVDDKLLLKELGLKEPIYIKQDKYKIQNIGRDEIVLNLSLL